MRKNLQERKAELERQKIAIMGREKALKETERRERTKKLIEMGGLISKAGIDTLDTNALYGAFLSIKEKMNKAEALQQWSQKGVNAFSRGGNAGEGVPLVVQFKEKPSEEARLAIRSLGLKWNAIRQEWQGIANLEDVESVVKQHNGNVVSMAS